MRIQLDIAAVSPGVTGDTSYIVVLRESGGERNLPIIIGQAEAGAIIMHMRGNRPARPMSHDLMASIISETGLHVEYVCIRSVEDGVYKSDVSIRNGSERAKVDARTSDALALAVRVGCPVYVESDVLEENAVYEEETEEYEEREERPEEKPAQPARGNKPPHSKPPKSLQERLQDAIDREDYEEAARLRDEISGQ
jgi:bifunctional DNase/RNase